MLFELFEDLHRTVRRSVFGAGINDASKLFDLAVSASGNLAAS